MPQQTSNNKKRDHKLCAHFLCGSEPEMPTNSWKVQLLKFYCSAFETGFQGPAKKPQRKVNRNRSQLAVFVSAFKSIIRLQTRPATTCFVQHRNRQTDVDRRVCTQIYFAFTCLYSPVYPACEEMPNNDHDKNQTGTSLIKAAIKNIRTHIHSCLHTCICLYRIIQIYGGGRQEFNKKQKMIIKTSFSTTTNQNKNHCNHTCSSAIHNNGCSWCTPAAGSCRNFV